MLGETARRAGRWLHPTVGGFSLFLVTSCATSGEAPVDRSDRDTETAPAPRTAERAGPRGAAAEPIEAGAPGPSASADASARMADSALSLGTDATAPPPVALAEDVRDQPVPGTQGGGASLRASAGPGPREFHLTFEKAGQGHYVWFDGSRWSAPVVVAPEAPFRSGVHVAVSPTGDVHFVWGTGRTGACRYRVLHEGQLGPIEDVEPKTAWGECDLALDRDGSVLVAVTRSTEGLAVYTRMAEGGWTHHEFPRTDTSASRWAATIAVTAQARVYVAARKKPDDHPTIWHVRENGVWSKEQVVPGNKKEPFGIAVGEGYMVAAAGTPNFFHVEPAAGGQHEVRTARLAISTPLKRGQHIGLALTRRGTLYASHSNQSGGSSEDLTLRPGQHYMYSTSSDRGRTWKTNLRVSDSNAGQGYGAIAAQGDDVLLVWPDLRGGAHVRFSVLHEP